MRILRWIREKRENKFQDQKKEILINELEKLKSGNLSSLKYVYGGLTYKDSEINKNIGKAISDCFDGKSLVEIIKYAEGVKEASLLEYCFEFKDFNLSDIKFDFENENEYQYLLELGSFHPNGYFRERCLREMANCQGTLPFIILRLNDWVEEVRKCALNQTFEKIKSCTISEVINSLVAVEKINNSSRREDEKINGINYLKVE